MKKLFITMMAGLILMIVAPSCYKKGEKIVAPEVTNETQIAYDLAKSYDFPVNVNVRRINGEVIGYYVFYGKEEEFKNNSGDTTILTLTYVIEYNPNGEFVGKVCAFTFDDAIAQLDSMKS